MAESGPAVEEPREEVLKDEQALEYLLMSMRLSEGMDVARYERLAGRPLDSGRLEGLAELGLVRADSGRLMATAEGRPLLNGILRELAK
jgi:oxygen-independent coproporphyrinogen-3 oxidase